MAGEYRSAESGVMLLKFWVNIINIVTILICVLEDQTITIFLKYSHSYIQWYFQIN